jgi:hypothetical protein
MYPYMLVALQLTCHFRYVLGAVETFLDALPSAGLFQSKFRVILVSMFCLYLRVPSTNGEPFPNVQSVDPCTSIFC